MTGSVQVMKNGSYRLFVSGGFDGNGKRIRYTKTIKAKSGKEAEKELALFVAECEKGEMSNLSGCTLKEFSERWIEEHVRKNLAPKTLQSYLDNLNNRIIPALGNKKLKDLRPLHLIKFYNQLIDAPRLDGKSGTISGRSRQNIHRIIGSMLNDAVQWQLIPSNPASRVEPPKATKKKIDYYNEEETAHMLAALDNEEFKWKMIIYIAILTGMRRGEIMGLEWQDIDFDNGLISIERTSQYVYGLGTITKDPKTESSKRIISIPPMLGALLKQYKSSQNEHRLQMGDLWKGTNRLFTTWDGDPMFPDSVSNWFGKFIKKHNLPHISFHGLRHTSATLLINEGLNIKAISARLGHADTTTTLNIYTHALQSVDREASNRLEKMFNTTKK